MRVALGLQIGNDFGVVATLRAQQLGLASQRGQFGLLLGLDTAQLGELDPIAVQLCGQALLRRNRLPEPFFEQNLLGLASDQPALEIKAQPCQGDQAECQTDQ